MKNRGMNEKKQDNLNKQSAIEGERDVQFLKKKSIYIRLYYGPKNSVI